MNLLQGSPRLDVLLLRTPKPNDPKIKTCCCVCSNSFQASAAALRGGHVADLVGTDPRCFPPESLIAAGMGREVMQTNSC